MFDYEFFLTFLAAPALQTAKETPRIAFAPNLPEKKTTTQYKTTTAIIKCYMFISDTVSIVKLFTLTLYLSY